MLDDQLQAAIASATTAKGSGPLRYADLLALLQRGRDLGMTVSTIDVTSENGWKPRPEWGLHLDATEIDQLGPDRQSRAEVAYSKAVEGYRDLDVDADELEFEAWFWCD